MLEKLCKTVLIFSFFLNIPTALANNFTHQNVSKAKNIFDKVVSYYGGKKAIENIDNILTDYDYSTNYRTQGFGYKGTDYHSNRPGNILSLIAFTSRINWTQNQYKYLKSYYSKTSLYQKGIDSNYNNITRTFTTRTQNNFEKHIENQLLRNPLHIIKAALTKNGQHKYLGSKSNDGKSYFLLGMTLPSNSVITAYVDQQNYQIAKVELLSNGELTEYFYNEYKNVGQFKLPFFIKKNMPDNYYSSYFYYRVASYDFSPNVKKLTAMPTSYSLAEDQDNYDNKLRMQIIGKGIYWLTQNGANTIFIEFSDHVMAVDAYGFNLSSRIEKFRELVPNKPIRYVSISHHHDDHIDQVAFYAKQGATIITAEAFIPLIKHKFKQADNNESPKLVFDIVTKKRIYADKTQNVELYELKNMLHAETMLMTYLPNEQLIYLPDHYEEMSLIENRHAVTKLLAEIERLDLDVKGFIQGHGNDVFSLAKIQAALAHPIEMKNLRRQPHSSVTHSE